jgi:hypothetical protein
MVPSMIRRPSEICRRLRRRFDGTIGRASADASWSVSGRSAGGFFETARRTQLFSAAVRHGPIGSPSDLGPIDQASLRAGLDHRRPRARFSQPRIGPVLVFGPQKPLVERRQQRPIMSVMLT